MTADKPLKGVRVLVPRGGKWGDGVAASLRSRGAATVELCTLLDKAARRIVPVQPRYAGFDCPDAFVVGYGLDFQERYRNLADILEVFDQGALRADPDLLQSLVAPAA